MTADQIISFLNLTRHPEGGWYRQTWQAEDGPRPSGTCIYFLLKDGETSHWHRVDAAEIWHFYAGAPLILKLCENELGPAKLLNLGSDLERGEAPQHLVPEGWWQSAETTGDFTLVGCTVSPGFQFEGFELAPPNFDIPES